jgi:hypothetical protein
MTIPGLGAHGHGAVGPEPGRGRHEAPAALLRLIMLFKRFGRSRRTGQEGHAMRCAVVSSADIAPRGGQELTR